MKGKLTSVLLTTAMLLPVAGLVAATPADAVGGTVCKTATGTATFKPPLPIASSPVKVKPTITIKNGKLSGCIGGGVTSAILTATLKMSIANNCKTLLAGAKTGTKGAQKLTWNNKKTSTVTLTLTGVPKKPTQTKATGPVTLGLFKGSKQAGTLQYTLPKGACSTKALSTVTFKQLLNTKITIK